MLFNSFEFLFVFLPIVFFASMGMLYHGRLRLAVAFVVLSSLFFYGYWNPKHLWVILLSITVTYSIGTAMSSWPNGTGRKLLLGAGCLFNLRLLAWFKYAGFLAGHFSVSSDVVFMDAIRTTVLPIGISFYTFQQIAYLVDAYDDRVKHNPLNYAFFVSFFPQLIAGPIVHHRELIPQISGMADRVRSSRYVSRYLAPGISLIAIGLAKKVILADNIGDFADLAFDAAHRGAAVTFIEAWGGAVAYALQIYFDFSAYSDMAIGLGMLFGLTLPINFLSPYKATSIIDFWRRWHITLSRFLRDYLYVPLGGNRKGPTRRFINLLLTMLLGGLWHGAGWTFVLWGGLHGLYLIANHAWRQWVGIVAPRWLAIGVTFFLVVVAWVPFRAANFSVVQTFWQAMSGIDGIALPESYAGVVTLLGPLAQLLHIHAVEMVNFGGLPQIALLLIGLAIVWFTPSAMQLLNNNSRREFIMSWRGAGLVGVSFSSALIAMFIRQKTTFLYFQF